MYASRRVQAHHRARGPLGAPVSTSNLVFAFAALKWSGAGVPCVYDPYTRGELQPGNDATLQWVPPAQCKLTSITLDAPPGSIVLAIRAGLVNLMADETPLPARLFSPQSPVWRFSACEVMLGQTIRVVLRAGNP